ncbi:hypothetical protein F5B22DRAFT_438973 [Xylaria bambusicola]|uniref:uncharacterized protein n=1 Tax=Xylaria bambusicola TaxID=326684 RepID=UPI002008CE9E|nr:uncharacterized protein F5B22DRAFT_438973 [Xylaria bambusicola]KAI0506654.1 hypothetical protein F5B22DRAFT_438973 [Xylaria bambusicola]
MAAGQVLCAMLHIISPLAPDLWPRPYCTPRRLPTGYKVGGRAEIRDTLGPEMKRESGSLLVYRLTPFRTSPDPHGDT